MRRLTLQYKLWKPFYRRMVRPKRSTMEHVRAAWEQYRESAATRWAGVDDFSDTPTTRQLLDAGILRYISLRYGLFDVYLFHSGGQTDFLEVHCYPNYSRRPEEVGDYRLSRQVLLVHNEILHHLRSVGLKGRLVMAGRQAIELWSALSCVHHDSFPLVGWVLPELRSLWVSCNHISKQLHFPRRFGPPYLIGPLFPQWSCRCDYCGIT